MRKRRYLKAAFAGGQLITGENEPAIKDSVVVIEDGKIVYAGARDGEGVPELNGYEVIDVTGSIVKGKSADMLVIDGDPLKCIYDIDVDKMDMIIKEGEKIVRI